MPASTNPAAYPEEYHLLWLQAIQGQAQGRRPAFQLQLPSLASATKVRHQLYSLRRAFQHQGSAAGEFYHQTKWFEILLKRAGSELQPSTETTLIIQQKAAPSEVLSALRQALGGPEALEQALSRSAAALHQAGREPKPQVQMERAEASAPPPILLPGTRKTASGLPPKPTPPPEDCQEGDPVADRPGWIWRWIELYGGFIPVAEAGGELQTNPQALGELDPQKG